MDKFPRKYLFPVLAVMILSSLIGLNSPKIYFGDEAYYLSAGFNMLNSHDWLTPWHEGEMRFQKPILFYWLVAGSYKLFGVSLFAARLPSIVAMAALAYVIWLLGEMLFDSETGIYSALVFVSMPMTIWYGRTAMTDMVLSLFAILAFYFGVRGFLDLKRRKLCFMLSYVFMGLGVLTKGIAGLFFPMTATVVYGLTCSEDKKAILSFFHPLNFAIFICIVLPWPALMWAKHGEKYTSHILREEIAGRFGISLWKPFRGIAYYTGVLLRYNYPWFLIALVEAIRRNGALRATWQSNRKSVAPLAIFGGIIFIGYALFIFDQRARYMLPATAAIAIFVGAAIQRTLLNSNGKILCNLLFGAFLMIVIAVITVFGIALCVASQVEWLRTMSFAVTLVALSAGVSIALYCFFKKHFSRFVVAVCLTLCVSANLILGWAAPAVSRSPVTALLNEIPEGERKGASVFIYGCELSDGERTLLSLSLNYETISIKKEVLENRFSTSGMKQYILIGKRTFESLPDNIQGKFSVLAETFGFDRIDAAGLFKSICYGRVNEFLEKEKIKYFLLCCDAK